MKLYNLILITALSFFAICTSAQNNVTFQVDMSTVDSSTFTTPEVNGDFNGWCGSCASMTDANGDNIWDIAAGVYNAVTVKPFKKVLP